MSTENQPPSPLVYDDFYTPDEVEEIMRGKPILVVFNRKKHAQQYNAWRAANAVSVDRFDDDGIIVSSESLNLKRIDAYEERCRVEQERKFNERVAKRQRWSRIYNWWQGAFWVTVSAGLLFAVVWFYVEGTHSK